MIKDNLLDHTYTPISSSLIKEEKRDSLYDNGEPYASPFYLCESNLNMRGLMCFMRYPFFSLSKNRISSISFNYKDISIKVVAPHEIGVATIYDCDLLIWLTSQLAQYRNKGITATRVISMRPSAYFRDTGRIKSGREYKVFMATLVRLKTTTIITNLQAGKRSFSHGFSLVDNFVIAKDNNGKVLGAQIKLSEWFYRQCTVDMAYLAIPPSYFDLKGGIERWLYNIARKHCGNNPCWKLKIQTLFIFYPNKNRKLRFFKRDVLKVVKNDNLPEYHLELGKEEHNKDIIYFTPRLGLLLARKYPKALKHLAADLS